MLRGGAAATFVGAGPLALAVTSLLCSREGVGFGSTGDAVREQRLGAREPGAFELRMGVREPVLGVCELRVEVWDP